MGSSDSKHSKKDSSCLFSRDEIAKLDDIYNQIKSQVSQEKSINDDCSFSQLYNYVKPHLNDEHVVTRLHDTLCSLSSEAERGSSCFNIHGLRRYLAMLFRGTPTERSLSTSVLISKQNVMSLQEITQFVTSMTTQYLGIVELHPSSKHWHQSTSDHISAFALYIIHQLTNKDETKTIGDSPSMYTESDLELWLTTATLFNHIIDLIFHTCFNFTTLEGSRQNHEPIIPRQALSTDSKHTLLHQLSVIVINHHIDPDTRSSWRLLFNSGLHGNSFAQLVNRVAKQGPVVIIIRDKTGRVFGAFSDVSLTENSDFYGTYRCFVFSLHPHFGVFVPTGHNENYVYLNHGVKTLPNGLGFGGQLDYFGLWIDESFSYGHSKGGPLCSTYGNPCLSSQPDFEIDTVEAWGIGNKPDEKSQQTSILDADPGAKAILELVGKGGHSEGLREDDETAYIPGEHDLPLL